MVAVSLYLVWSKHTPTFRPDDDCLIRQRGSLGSTRHVIALLGVITPYQMPVIGPWLDVSNVNMDVVAYRGHIGQIARFNAFRGRIQAEALQQQVASGRPSRSLFNHPPRRLI